MKFTTDSIIRTGMSFINNITTINCDITVDLFESDFYSDQQN